MPSKRSSDRTNVVAEALFANDVDVSMLVDALRLYVDQRNEANDQLTQLAGHLRSGGTHGLFAPGEAGATAADRMAEGHRDLAAKAEHAIEVLRGHEEDEG